MEFTELQQELIGNAALLATEGRGMVLEEHALADAQELADAGWLEKRPEPKGEVSWWWSPRGDMALALNGLTDVSGRDN